MSTSRLVRRNIILSPYVYSYSTEFKKGSEIEADALSRLTLPDQTNVEVAIHSFNLVDEIPLSNSEIANFTKRIISYAMLNKIFYVVGAIQIKFIIIIGIGRMY